MSQIDLDKLFDVIGQPQPDVLIYKGKSHTLKRLTNLDVASFDTMNIKAPGETDEKHFERILARVRSLFEGDAPAFLAPAKKKRTVEERSEITKKVTALAAAIGQLIGASSGNHLARAKAEAARQIEAARAIGSE